MKYTLECCVDSVESAINAKNGGANRLELCSNLIIGGTTPTYSLFNHIKKAVDIKTNILIRPRFGDFLYSDYEFSIICEDIKAFKELGANGIVVGFLKEDGEVDIEKVELAVALAKGMQVTFHRAFDVCKNPIKALRELEKLRVNTILTGGQHTNCIDGFDLIDELIKKSRNVEILVGGGVDLKTVKIFVEKTNAISFHMSGKKVIKSKMKFRKNEASMGLPSLDEYMVLQTDEKNVCDVFEYLKGEK